MVRDVRIKEVRFSEVISASNTGSFVSSSPINGEILEVDWAYGSQGVGSIFLTFGATQEEFFRRDAASGAGTQVGRPYVSSQSTTGSIAGTFTTHVPFVTNDHIVLNTKAVLSGTTALSVNVRYR